ncbi:uncharacterized protein LOC129924717 [Biomphalaria glabrata]|uniref:Uncharacterized protein LOC129924717 n=1 Tax=Biomphalaria glabrata TaxID=6526 RepID=A0A9W2ZQH4_BIOGL|nr:uncharacterized protein LOC129924717 [Biomphalaria glabrata]
MTRKISYFSSYLQVCLFLLGCWLTQVLSLENIFISGYDNSTIALRRVENEACIETVNVQNDNSFMVNVSISNETYSRYYTVNSMQQMSFQVRDLIIINVSHRFQWI